MSKDNLTEAQARERATWQYRVVERTRGNQTMLGCIMLSVLGRPARHPPMFGPTAVIDLEGVIWADWFQNRLGTVHKIFPIGPTSQLVDQLNRLADDLQLGDDDVKAMFAEVRKWITADARALTADVISTGSTH